MTLAFYNTLTRRKEAFRPIDTAQVRLYVCGPTVYDFAHIGNARPVIVFDVVFRLLRHVFGDDHVVYVRNITDVDDKINERAKRDFPDLPLNEAIARVTTATTAQFHADIAALGVLKPTHEPRATEHIAGMRDIIERLVAGGFAYVAADHVLFSPAAMDAANGGLPRYGALANRSLDEMIAGARVDVAPYKRDPTDFVLWKPSSREEPGWPSPCGIAGLGRPGWHIECSAMSRAFLGEVFDIHGGGIDLVFPHHENEIAQSTCAFGHGVMAKVWMHNGFLQVEGEKMSKSLGNFITIRELLQSRRFGGRFWSGEALRLAMLKTHYRQPINWTPKLLHEAEENLGFLSRIRFRYEPEGFDEKFVEYLYDDLNTKPAIDRLLTLAHEADAGDPIAGGKLASGLKLLGFFGESIPRSASFETAALDAQGSPISFDDVASTSILKLFPQNAPVSYVIRRLNQASANDGFDLVKVLAWIKDLGRFAGENARISDLVCDFQKSRKINSLIEARLSARAERNWAASDKIRDELAALGVQLKDGKDPVSGEPVTTWEARS